MHMKVHAIITFKNFLSVRLFFPGNIKRLPGTNKTVFGPNGPNAVKSKNKSLNNKYANAKRNMPITQRFVSIYLCKFLLS